MTLSSANQTAEQQTVGADTEFVVLEIFFSSSQDMKDNFKLSSMFPAIPMSQTAAHHTATALKNNLFYGSYGNPQPNLLRHTSVRTNQLKNNACFSRLFIAWVEE